MNNSSEKSRDQLKPDYNSSPVPLGLGHRFERHELSVFPFVWQSNKAFFLIHQKLLSRRFSWHQCIEAKLLASVRDCFPNQSFRTTLLRGRERHPRQRSAAAAVAAKLFQSCLTLCNPIEGSPPCLGKCSGAGAACLNH